MAEREHNMNTIIRTIRETTFAEAGVVLLIIGILLALAVGNARVDASHHRAAAAHAASLVKQGDLAADDLDDAAGRLSSAQYLAWKQSVRTRHSQAAADRDFDAMDASDAMDGK